MATRIWYVGATPCTTPSLGRDAEWAPGSYKDLETSFLESLGVDTAGSLFVSTAPDVAASDPEPAPDAAAARVSPEPTPLEETPAEPGVEGT